MKRINYIAYGVTMLQDKLFSRIGYVYFKSTGMIPNKRLVFNKTISGSPYSTPNIQQAEEGVHCPCVIYEIMKWQLDLLDMFEGHPVHYNREQITVVDANNVEVTGIIYVATPNTQANNPDLESLETLHRAYKYYGFDSNTLPELPVPPKRSLYEWFRHLFVP